MVFLFSHNRHEPFYFQTAWLPQNFPKEIKIEISHKNHVDKIPVGTSGNQSQNQKQNQNVSCGHVEKNPERDQNFTYIISISSFVDPKDNHNTSAAWDNGCLEEVNCHHLEYLKTARFGLSRGLVSHRPPRGELLKLLEREYGRHDIFLTSDAVQYSPSAQAWRHDVVAWDDGARGFRVGRIMFFYALKDDDDCVAMISEFHLLRRSGHDADYSCAEAQLVPIFVDTIVDTLVWSSSGDIVTVLLPYRLRR